MAIHPKHPELCAEVVTSDGPLEEYDDDQANQDRPSYIMAKYVQVGSDAQFGIRYTVPKILAGECGVRAQLFLDGKRIYTYNHNREDFGAGNVTKCMDKVRTTVDGFNYEQRFRFTQLHMDEDADRNEHTPQQLQPIGTVEIRLSRVNSITERDRTPELNESSAVVRKDKLPVFGGIAEKCLKGDVKSHQASLDVPIFTGVATSSRSKTKKVRKCGISFAIFRFKYRSLAALKSLHIVDRTPSSSPTPPAQRAVEDMTREELEAIVRNSQIKSEPGASNVNNEGGQKVKREAGADGEVEFVSRKRKKAVPSQKDEVIVLD